MNPIAMLRKSRPFGIFQFAALALALLPAARLQASPPIEPLPAPYYSFDLESPSVWAGVFEARDILQLGPGGPEPAIYGAMLGLESSFDDLDCLSGPHAAFPPTASFVLLFSVDRNTQGTTPPDPLLVGLDVPYNALDQAERGQAAGDEYMSTTLFTLEGGLAGRRGSIPQNNCLGRNNFDEGGSDFGGDPPTSASETSTSSQDEVDAVAGFSPSARGGIVNVYFSVTSASPSLATLPGYQYPSGANIFFNSDPANGAPTELYAYFDSLGLQQADDLDAMLVFDLNHNGMYDGQDVVLFSLAPGSPSLELISQASPIGAAADVFIARANFMPLVEVFAHAADLGLGAPPDNIDALDVFICPDAIECAALHGIRYPRGDLNCDHLVNAFDIDPFVLALTSPADYYAAFPDCEIARADINRDGLINAFDIDPFVVLLTGGL
jgi:hypothetical protein